MYYYSASTCGFYFDEVHTDIPQDAVGLSVEMYNQLIAAQERGMEITTDEKGVPVAVKPVLPSLTKAELTQRRIAEIQKQLTANDLASVRPLRAKVAGTATAEDEARLVELEEQAQALRAELAEVSA